MHELFEELEAFNPKWRLVYRTIRDAAQAASVLGLYYQWRMTSEGSRYLEHMDGVPNYSALQEDCP